MVEHSARVNNHLPRSPRILVRGEYVRDAGLDGGDAEVWIGERAARTVLSVGCERLCIMDARRNNRELKVAIDELGWPLPEGWVDLIKDMMDVVPAAAQQVSGDRSIAALMFDFIIPNDLVDIGEES